jgi:hypothetical protein
VIQLTCRFKQRMGPGAAKACGFAGGDPAGLYAQCQIHVFGQTVIACGAGSWFGAASHQARPRGGLRSGNSGHRLPGGEGLEKLDRSCRGDPRILSWSREGARPPQR